jgi:hypothetical protein
MASLRARSPFIGILSVVLIAGSIAGCAAATPAGSGDPAAGVSADDGGDAGRASPDATDEVAVTPDVAPVDDAPADAALLDVSSLDVSSLDVAMLDEPSSDASTSDVGLTADATTPDEADAASPDATPADATPPTFAISTSPLSLHPTFSPTIHDYYVRCATGINDVTITLSGPSQASLDVHLSEDQVTMVEDQGGDESQVYWIRCLPHDFPTIIVTPHPAAGTPTPGWYFVSNASVAPGESSFAIVVDGNGTPVWYHRSTAGSVIDIELLSKNTIAYSPYVTYGHDDAFQTFELNPWHTDVVQGVDMLVDPHDLRVLPNGDRLLLGAPIVDGIDLTGLEDYGPDATIVDCALQEIDASGAVVWQWLATDHVDAAKESTAPSGGQSLVDTFHCNSIDVDELGNLLVSARQMDAVFYIEKASGKILWKLGGTPYSKDGARLLQVANDPQVAFYRQHDARFRPNGSISLFDDHGVGTGPARGIEYALDLESGTATPTWQYKGPTISLFMGSFRRYDDGMNVIGWGAPASGSLVLTEVDDAGNDLLDLSFGPGDATYRATKVPLDALDIDLLRTTAGMP